MGKPEKAGIELESVVASEKPWDDSGSPPTVKHGAVERAGK